MNWRLWLSASYLAVFLAGMASFAEAAEPGPLYQQHCAACHGEGRLGGVGPALLPENLERLKKPEALKIIREGRIATQMPGFQESLKPEESEALANWIYTKVVPAPVWDEAEIRASQIVGQKPPALTKPKFKADWRNLFVVVETGDHHVSILDGDRMERIHRFQSRYALHGGPKFTPDGRFVFFASRDGWVTKYDIWNLEVVAEIRAGLNTRNVAVSGDGKYVMVANYLPHTLVLLDAQKLDLMKIIPVAQQKTGKTSRVSAVYDAAPRMSFVAALKDIPEVWEISYDPDAQPITEGLVHDFQYKEGDFIPGQFNPRRTKLKDFLDDFFFTQSYDEIIGASRDATKGQVINLDARKRIADLDLPGMPHLGSGISFTHQGRRVLATPNLREGLVTFIDMETWKNIKSLKTPGPGFFMRSHENSRYLWVDSMMSPTAKNTLTVIDKETLEIVASPSTDPGKTLAHIEFDREGKHALASLWEQDGALVVFDAKTLKEVKRIPMKKPVGKYNIWNKITRSEGTSH